MRLGFVPLKLRSPSAPTQDLTEVSPSSDRTTVSTMNYFFDPFQCLSFFGISRTPVENTRNRATLDTRLKSLGIDSEGIAIMVI